MRATRAARARSRRFRCAGEGDVRRRTGDLFAEHRAPPSPASGRARGKPEAARQDKAASLKGTPISLAAARAEAARKTPVDRSKYQTIRSLDQLNGLDRAGARCRPCRDRGQGQFDRSDAGRDLRHRAGARRPTTPATSRSATSNPATAPACSPPASRRTRSRPATRSTALRPLLESAGHPEDRLQHQVQRRDVRAARHHPPQP